MRCQTSRRTIWTDSGRIRRLWRKSVFVIYSFYFAVTLLNCRMVTVVSSVVCPVEGGSDVERCCSSNNTSPKAMRCLKEILNDSSDARVGYRSFCQVISQFDCTTTYSVKWTCTDCLDAYTKWLLKVFSPSETWLSNCIDQTSGFCEAVLAKCPHFFPNDGYGDLPAFDCPSEN